ncbi:helix-turn-helix domain-containing protein [Herbiconiux sp. VKM Ac-2851]|uniref:AlbA family DNA-binding domain-containing protein n=1 Tax=Herbiconiux sp. VKM Ac-2851 TaxID=2739025 RepID=UPI0015679E14|nr:ATP-binding protein [Herbiconiux sp. VKM Ac-2851]NQX33299.1 ATP-binding protein [Herbiconiux sp. VKM Ac-2851]
MLHTPLHRLLGEFPGPLTDHMIDAAVANGLQESDLLDWKGSLPPQKEFRESDIVKDIAAFANASGGIIVFGVNETNKVASGRVDAGQLTENYERTIHQTCMAAITPPVFGVQVISIPTTTNIRAVALVIPSSADGPHLIYRNDYFGAPLRVNADTHWMKERQIENAYRSRFEAAHRGEEGLQRIYDDMAAVSEAGKYAVMVGVARPRALDPKLQAEGDVTSVATRASLVAQWWLSGPTAKYNPLEDLDIYRPRPTLAGNYLPPANPDGHREAHAAVFDDGSVGLTWRAGGHEHRMSGKRYEPHQIPTVAVEGFSAALAALVHAAADGHASDYEIVIGVELLGPASRVPEFHERDAAPPYGVHRTFAGRFRPVRTTVAPYLNDTDFIVAPIDLATACLNQVGIKKPRVLSPMLPQRPREWSW